MKKRQDNSQRENSRSASRKDIQRAATYIHGVDEVLHGGIPAGRNTLVEGGPGSGKTVFALEQLCAATQQGEPGVFVTFEEQEEAVRRNARAFGWEVDRLEQRGLLRIVHAPVPLNAVATGEFDLGGFLALLKAEVESIGARRIVIDAVDLLMRLFPDLDRCEEQLILLHNWLNDQQITAILTAKARVDNPQFVRLLEHMIDCVICLDHRVVGQVATRRMRIIKYRGSSFQSNEFPFVISEDGIVLMPITNALLDQKAVGPKFSTGIPGLDQALAGGFGQGSCVIVGGATGTGKTTIGCSVAISAAGRDEHVLYITLEENEAALIESMKSVGLDLQAAIDDGSLQVLTVMPEASGGEEHLWRIVRAVEDHKPAHVIVDAISACRRMGTDSSFDFVLRLLVHCRSQNISCIYLNQTTSDESIHAITGVGISSLVDTLILLEQDWPGDVHRRRARVVKMRGSRHSHRPMVFRITDSGVQLEHVPDSSLDNGP